MSANQAQQFGNLSRAGFAVAQANYEAFERLSTLNVAAAKDAYASASSYLQSVVAAKSPQELAQIGSAAAEKVARYGQDMLALAVQVQGDIAKAYSFANAKH